MRQFFWYFVFSVALWYLLKAALRHYLAPTNRGGSNGRNEDRNIRNEEQSRTRDRVGGNYESAREARYRDID